MAADDPDRLPDDIYDALSPHYREYSRSRQAYLSGVERFILEHAPAAVESMLDVGAGDGIRGAAIARRLGAKRWVLCEPSREMAASCRKLAPSEIWQVTAEQLPETDQRFDLILCLWNVLGHIAGQAGRLAALKAMKRLAAPGGMIFFDVNNRHNAGAYGWLRVGARRVIDCLAPDERRGDAVYHWKIGDRSLPARGHLFTPAEIEGMIAQSGLRIVRRSAVDYVTGARSASPFRGQLLYQVAS